MEENPILRSLKLERSILKVLAKSNRFKDIDPRPVVRSFRGCGGIVYGPIVMGGLLTYELAYEIYRHLNKNVKLDRPIFIIGVPHSGTTISMKLFSIHPDITNASELNTYWHPVDYLDVNANHEKTEQDVTDLEIARLHSRFQFERWLRGNRPRFLNKDPNNTVRMDFIRKVFPDSYIIHIIRDGRAVVSSLIYSLPADWETKDRFKPYDKRINPWPGVKPPRWRLLLRDDPCEQHALQWRESIKYARKRKDRLRDHYYEIRYEDLCENPRGVLAKAYRFVGLSVNNNTLKNLPKKLDNKNFKWKENLTDSQIKTVNEIQIGLLRELGYDV